MSLARGTWYRLFSPTLEDCINGSSKEGIFPKKLSEKLTPEEIEAFNMWNYKQLGILPNHYHHSYENGDTLIYPEHIRDLMVIDKMIYNKHEADRKKEAEEAARKQKNNKNSLGAASKKGGAGFYGHTFKFNNT